MMQQIFRQSLDNIEGNLAMEVVLSSYKPSRQDPEAIGERLECGDGADHAVDQPELEAAEYPNYTVKIIVVYDIEEGSRRVKSSALCLMSEGFSRALCSNMEGKRSKWLGPWKVEGVVCFDLPGAPP